MIRFKKIFKIIYLIGLIILPVILLILPGNYFDTGNSMCISVIFLDRNCFGCGMTKAIQHLIHLDFTVAYSFNKLSFIVLPLLVVAYIKELRKLFSFFKKKVKID